MLIEFRVANHRSIRDEQVFTMEASRSSDADSPHVRQLDEHKKALVTVAAIYGANASGKSNVLSALAFMRDAVVESHRFWDPAGGIPRDPFAWGETRREPSLFEVSFLYNKTKYQYGFVINDEHVLEEWLYAWPTGHKQVWFERDQGFKFGEHLKGENKVVEHVTRTNALFLSAAAQLGHRQLQDVYSWFASLLQNELISRIVRPRFRRERQLSVVNFFSDWDSRQLSFEFTSDRLSQPHVSEWIKALLRVADVGISDFRVQHDDSRARPRVQFLHDVGDVPDAWLPMEEESAGTLSLLRIAGLLFAVLSHGGILVIDELERSLHPLLSLYIIKQFKEPATNPKHAQLIFTTHDTTLLGTTLGPPALARDQIWLAEKDRLGASAIYPLTDYKPRKSENVERGYLQGRYGAVPFLGILKDPSNL